MVHPDDSIGEDDAEAGEGRLQVDVVLRGGHGKRKGLPIVTEELLENCDGARVEFGDSEIALFPLPPFKVLRNKVDRHWIGRYTASTPLSPCNLWNSDYY
jgi:hypothetical protein